MSEQNKTETAVEAAPANVDPNSPDFTDTLAAEFSGLFDQRPAKVESKEVAPEAEETAPAGGAEAAAEAEQPEQPAAATSTTSDEATEEKPLLSPQLAAAAAREREVRAKIKALEESREDDIKAAVEQAVSAVIQEIQAGNFEKHNLDPGDLALRAYAAELGDEAPAELKQQLGLSEADKKYAELQAQIEQLKQEQASAADRMRAQTALEQYEGFVSAVPSELKFFAAEAAHDSNDALRSMAKLADHVYATEGRLLSAHECAKVLDDQIRATVERYGLLEKPVEQAAKPTASNVAAETNKQETTPTLSNSLQSGKANPSPMSEDELYEDALRFGIESGLLKPRGR